MIRRSGARGTSSAQAAGLGWHVRLHLHLALASIPVLAISAHVLWSVSLRFVVLAVLAPLAVLLAGVVVGRPHPSDRLLLVGFLWGLAACAGYDAFRLPTIYGLHWWRDFFGSVGGWATDSRSNFFVGYLWRYLGDGGGIAAAFFPLRGIPRRGGVAQTAGDRARSPVRRLSCLDRVDRDRPARAPRR